MTARTTYEAAIASAAKAKLASDLNAEMVRQTTVDAKLTVVGFNLQTGDSAALATAIKNAAATKLASDIQAEATRQIEITNARDTLRATGDVGPG